MNSFLFAYVDEDQTRIGLQKGNTLYSLRQSNIPSFEFLMMEIPSSDLIKSLEGAIDEPLILSSPMTLKGLLKHQPIWASGVTYKMSEEARERESNQSNLYSRVYNAQRPELFWKSMGYEIASSEDKVGIRADASWSVPEPELTMLINGRGEFIGFTIGNDMSSRDIEGENALYLPQAKVYDDACALGPRIWLCPDRDSWGDLSIQIEIERTGSIVFSQATSTTQLKRTLPELMDYLLRCKQFPYGVLLMTGTGIVPPDEFTLQEGDIIRIQIDPIGQLVNTVHVVGKSHS